jgi:hypothetical protein
MAIHFFARRVIVSLPKSILLGRVTVFNSVLPVTAVKLGRTSNTLTRFVLAEVTTWLLS